MVPRAFRPGLTRRDPIRGRHMGVGVVLRHSGRAASAGTDVFCRRRPARRWTGRRSVRHQPRVLAASFWRSHRCDRPSAYARRDTLYRHRHHTFEVLRHGGGTHLRRRIAAGAEQGPSRRECVVALNRRTFQAGPDVRGCAGSPSGGPACDPRGNPSPESDAAVSRSISHGSIRCGLSRIRQVRSAATGQGAADRPHGRRRTRDAHRMCKYRQPAARSRSGASP